MMVLDPISPRTIAMLPHTHDAVEIEPVADPTLTFRTFVPKGWLRVAEIGGVEKGLGLPEPIGIFAASDAPSSPLFVATSTRIPVEVNPEDWLRLRAAIEGWTLASSQWTETPSGSKLEAYAHRGESYRREFDRMTAFVDNGRLITTHAIFRLTDYAKMHELLTPSGLMLELAAPSGVRQFEPIVMQEIAGDETLCVEIPSSWTIEGRFDRRTIDAKVTAGQDLFGYLRVQRRAGPAALGELVRQVDHDLRGAGVRMPRHRDIIEAPPRVDGWLGGGSCEATMQGERVQVWTGYRGDPLGALVIVVLAPAAGRNPYAWMRCKRAFELAIETAGVAA